MLLEGSICRCVFSIQVAHARDFRALNLGACFAALSRSDWSHCDLTAEGTQRLNQKCGIWDPNAVNESHNARRMAFISHPLHRSSTS